MACLRLELIDVGRYQLQYPLTRSDDELYMFGSGPFEASYLDLSLDESDEQTFTFKRPFSGIPKIIAGFASLTPSVGNVNVYVESVTKTGGVVKTSAPITGKIILHAIYNVS